MILKYKPKTTKMIYGYKDGEYIGVMDSKAWGHMLGCGPQQISGYARKRREYKGWFFNYEQVYEPKKKYETI